MGKGETYCRYLWAAFGFLLKLLDICIMVVVAQQVRVPDCDSGGRRFDPGQPPSFSQVLCNACT